MGRGLHNFIRDLKNAATPEKESKRVQEELSKIRAKFRGDGALDTYNRKKYVWKLLYIHMLGYDVDFGVVEAIHLLALPGYSEKACGYLAVSLLLDEDHEMMQLVINSVRNDLCKSLDRDAAECHGLALGLLSNLGAGAFMEELCPLVTELMVDTNMDEFVRKKAALCLVNMNRKLGRQGDVRFLEDDAARAEVMKNVLSCLDTSGNLGLCTAAMSLLLSLTAKSQDGWDEAPRVIISLLTKTRQNGNNFAKGYTYFQIPSPWLQIKCMRSLQFFQPIAEDNLSRKQLLDILEDIITKTDISKKNQNKINALHSIFFEAINLCSHYCAFDDGASDTRELLLKAVDHLGRFLTDDKQASTNKNLKLCNVRYLALDTMSRLAVIPGGAQHLKKFTESFIIALDDDDMGIRSRALDVLYEMADKSTAAKIVDRFLDFLGDAENDVKEELVLKVAILAERWATKFDWYVDVILRLIAVAGDVVSNDIWYRVVFIVTNNEPHNPGLHKYAARKVFDAVKRDVVNENTVQVAAYLLGEFGYHIADEPETSFQRQFEVLQAKFAGLSAAAQAVVLNAYIKLRNSEPALDGVVKEALKGCCTHFDQELQQRACEYVMFGATAARNPEILPTVFEAMDFFPDRDNPLVQRLLDTDSHGQEADHFLNKKREKAELDPSADDDAGRSSMTMMRSGGGDPPPPPPPEEAEPEPQVAEVGDLLGLNESPPLAAPEPVPAVAEPVSAPVVAAGGGGGGGPQDYSHAQMGQQGVQVAMPGMGQPQPPPPVGGAPSSIAVEPSVLAAFHTKDKGRLFKDAQCEFGAILAVDRATKSATVTLFCANISTDSAMSSVSVALAPSASLQVAVDPAHQVPDVLGPRSQKKHVLQVRCVGPYEAAPDVVVSFVSGGAPGGARGQPRQITFALPVPFNRFVEPVPLQSQAFMATWGKVTPGAPLELQQVVDGQGAIADVETYITSLGLAVVSNLDPKPENRVFAAKFGGVPIMLRLEAHAASQKVRFTIRTTHAMVSSTILATVTAVLPSS